MLFIYLTIAASPVTVHVSYPELGVADETLVRAAQRGEQRAIRVGMNVWDEVGNNGSGIEFAPSLQIGNATVGGGSQSPQVSHASLSGVRKGKPKLSFALRTRNGAAAIKTATIRVPQGLSFSSSPKTLAKGLVVKSGRKQLKFTARASRRKLTITLKTPASGFQITLTTPTITVSKALAKSVDAGKVKTVQVLLTVTNTSHSNTPITLKLRAT
jgi:hypothetical protein